MDMVGHEAPGKNFNSKSRRLLAHETKVFQTIFIIMKNRH
jgi:hypothetical protein